MCRLGSDGVCLRSPRSAKITLTSSSPKKPTTITTTTTNNNNKKKNNNNNNNNNNNHNTTSYDKVDRFINAKRGCKECLHVETVPARSSKDAPIENVDRNIVSEEMKLICRQVGISRIYSHQEEAIRRARTGESVVVSTPTASGKSLCYIIPILEKIMSEPNARALLMYPLKALANNQAESFQKFMKRRKTRSSSETKRVYRQRKLRKDFMISQLPNKSMRWRFRRAGKKPKYAQGTRIEL